MSRLLSLFLEYINIISAVLIVMSVAALVVLVASEPNRGDGLFLAALIVLILITFINGLIALLMTTRQHMASIQSEKKQQLEHLNTIFIMSGAAEVEAEKRQDLKYPPTNL